MKNNMKKLVLFLIIVFFLWGIYFMVKRPIEPFVSGKCPTTLIKDGNHFFVYDPSMAKVPGVNPIQFKDLEEYKEYVDWQRKSNLNCPILHLEKVFAADGSHMYEIRQNFLESEDCGLQPKLVTDVFFPNYTHNYGEGIPDTMGLALT